MASTYSTNLGIELIGTGDQAGSWGNTTNTNLGTLIEQAVSGYVTQAMTTGNTTTITIPNGASGTARNMYIEMTGTGGANTFLVVPANKKLYFIYNNTTGAVTVKVTGQTGVSVAAGEKQILVSNGTDVVLATSYVPNTSATITTLNVTSANITTLSSTSANITTLTGTTSTYTNATATNLSSTSASISTLTGTNATVTNISDGLGAVRNIPQSSNKTAPYTLQTSDNGTYILASSGTITVPNNTFVAGNALSVYNNSTLDISLTLSTTTAYVSGSNVNRSGLTLSSRGLCTILFINPSACVVVGSVS